MEVPERMLNFTFPTAGDQAARMFNPGAVTSGYRVEQSNGFKKIHLKQNKKGEKEACKRMK
jgi:hypothetical protein